MPQHRSNDRPYIEPDRHDALTNGTPAPPQASARDEQTPDGRLMKGARKIPSMGGKATKGATHLSHRIDSETLTETYRKRARTLRRVTCAELARTVGAGVCGIIPSLFVKHASVATALAEQSLDEGDRDRAVKYAEASRMHLLYARELCAKDAKERPQESPGDRIRREIMETKRLGGDR
jgi:hypothetical protein